VGVAEVAPQQSLPVSVQYCNPVNDAVNPPVAEIVTTSPPTSPKIPAPPAQFPEILAQAPVLLQSGSAAPLAEISALAVIIIP